MNEIDVLMPPATPQRLDAVSTDGFTDEVQGWQGCVIPVAHLSANDHQKITQAENFSAPLLIVVNGEESEWHYYGRDKSNPAILLFIKG
ncbi:hypothetical protein [Deinococcus radiophilus]|uniref:Uncharacterized protein n=1 Tax=Deinococcus radiophilus TaxID=32062 RepID=A0A3S0JU96_9DEIO|nr:hypothetical protein [Deinococcus radiophilus]RTR29052.1 hypothetical protein EJ104_04200 [Deinococcus radiophilus]UFA49639.1 hypothetical protein LMT64_06960 [Deinococcus radiophilus]